MGECNRIDCRETATHAVKLVIPDANSDETSAEGCIGVELCARHIADAESWEFESLAAILAPHVAKLAAPGTVPDLSSAYVEAIPVTAAEHVEFMEAIGARP